MTKKKIFGGLLKIEQERGDYYKEIIDKRLGLVESSIGVGYDRHDAWRRYS